MDNRLRQQVEDAVVARRGKLRGHELRFICPVHDDDRPSADYNPKKGVWICRACGESGNYYHLARLLGLAHNGHRPDGFQETRRWDVGKASHVRLDKDGDKKRVHWEIGGIAGLQGLSTSDLPLYGIENVTDPRADIVVSEGEKATDPLTALGFQAVGTACGAAVIPSKASLQPLADHQRRVILCCDNDEPGRKHMTLIAARLKAMGKITHLLNSWPDSPEKGDAYDFVKSGHGADDIQAALEAASLYEGVAEDVRPTITVGNRQLRDLTADALGALDEANKPKPHLFRFGSGLARIGHDDRERPFTEQETESTMRYDLSQVATFVRYDAEGNKRNVFPPLELGRNILVAGAEWGRFPPLASIVEAPTVRPDFSILDTPGYDRQTALYLELARGLKVPPIPEKPTDGELQDAVKLVQEPTADFLFSNKASRANMTAQIMLSCIRDAITGPVPLTLVTKPQPGCGGSLLVDTTAIIATGRPARVVQAPRDPEEWRKLLTTLLISGDRYLTFDNVDRTLESEYLASFLTSTWWKDRNLGQLVPITLPNRTMVFANGNNAHVGGNLARRIVPVQLDSPGARVWMRDTQIFQHPQLRDWALEDRGRIIAAILTIVRGWVCTGKLRPEKMITLAGFEAYCEVMSSILAFMGVTDFLENLEELYNKIDSETPAWASFLETWLNEVGPQPITVADLVERIKDNDSLKSAVPLFVLDREGKLNTRRMGNQLAKMEGAKFDNGLTLARGGEYKHAVLWQIGEFTGETHRDLDSRVSLESSIPFFADANLEDKRNNNLMGVESNSQNSPNRHDLSLVLDSPKSDNTGGLGEWTTEQALDIWRADGMPSIKVPGATIGDLQKAFAGSFPVSYLPAIREYLNQAHGRLK